LGGLIQHRSRRNPCNSSQQAGGRWPRDRGRRATTRQDRHPQRVPTAAAHGKAMQALLSKCFPHAQIIRLRIAHRVFPSHSTRSKP